MVGFARGLTILTKMVGVETLVRERRGFRIPYPDLPRVGGNPAYPEIFDGVPEGTRGGHFLFV